MAEDVKKIVDTCKICKENQFKPAENHPAKFLKVSGIFDRIGIDLVLGLPETPEGYIGILVIVEYFTKYPYAVPIKSKTANEIAEQLWQYFCLFGPAKEILSDQGTEFVNEVVDSMINRIGSRHVVTSPYHPRTNGQCERFNKEIVSCLRKLVSDNPTDWTVWLNFALLAYRTRIHSVTKFSPIELMFGKKPNGFENWKDVSTESLEENILSKAKELQVKMSNDRTKALTNIEKGKDKQVKSQNKNQKVRYDKLKPGTKVYVTIDGIHNKLSPKYRGPFTIVECTKNDNYVLKNVLGEILKDSYPLNKLKIVNEADNDEAEVIDKKFYKFEKILDHRKVKNGYEYLIEWKKGNHTWEPTKNILDKKVIESYWSKIGKIPKKRGRKPKNHINFSGIINIIITLPIMI
ncbi:unnamed protein product [Brachionus calyciflorus]|uniref:Integrase catalytic domain-containing protein n=1 Tax=Brachionus calyciflorus TaxID=104777 RepID=A0A813MQY4_9BILA|nr:unnamed protein product [Brachionus calyciflorus]